MSTQDLVTIVLTIQAEASILDLSTPRDELNLNLTTATFAAEVVGDACRDRQDKD